MKQSTRHSDIVDVVCPKSNSAILDELNYAGSSRDVIVIGQVVTIPSILVKGVGAFQAPGPTPNRKSFMEYGDHLIRLTYLQFYSRMSQEIHTWNKKGRHYRPPVSMSERIWDFQLKSDMRQNRMSCY